ncbi:MAG: M3 family metallopeptidase [Chitinophagales bacterium]|nr:M3 family metallopeptidase [Chitinophagales bacterium]
MALEKGGQMLNRATNAFYLLAGANTNDSINQLNEEYSPKFSAHYDAIYMNDKLYRRVEKIYQQRDQLNLDSESKRLVEFYYQNFNASGAKLSDTDKEKLKALNSELATLTTKFGNLLLEGSKAAAVIVKDKSELDGLSEDEIKAFENNDSWKLPIVNTTQQPYLASLKNRDLRERVFEASWNRTERGDQNDTRTLIEKIAELRSEKANLLGFENFAAWKLQDQMAKDPKNVAHLLGQLIPATVEKGKGEAADIQRLIEAQGDTFKVQAWDWDFYAEQVRKEKYDLDESELKPYFVLDSVVKNGIFYAAEKLYGITFKENHSLPIYHDDVKVYEVYDHDGSALALFYTDFFKRDSKRGGAWMSNMVEQSTLLNKKPVIYNVCNFTKPAEGQVAFISFDDVTTIFHEFGHALHGMFASQKYPSLSGTATSRDFVEFPSQFNEHWAAYPEILKNYAKHYQTGEVIPQSLIDKVKKAATFNQGYAFGEYLACAALDMQWHTIGIHEKVKNVDDFEQNALNQIGTNLSYIPPRYRSSYFQHIWSNGYSAGYYAYCWSEMLDNDAYAWFEENGGLSRKNGQYFRDMILSRGNSEDLESLYLKFRGQEPNIKYLLKARGLEE